MRRGNTEKPFRALPFKPGLDASVKSLDDTGVLENAFRELGVEETSTHINDQYGLCSKGGAERYLMLGVSFWRVKYTLSRYVRTDCRMACGENQPTL